MIDELLSSKYNIRRVIDHGLWTDVDSLVAIASPEAAPDGIVDARVYLSIVTNSVDRTYLKLYVSETEMRLHPFTFRRTGITKLTTHSTYTTGLPLNPDVERPSYLSI